MALLKSNSYSGMEQGKCFEDRNSVQIVKAVNSFNDRFICNLPDPESSLGSS